MEGGGEWVRWGGSVDEKAQVGEEVRWGGGEEVRWGGWEGEHLGYEKETT